MLTVALLGGVMLVAFREVAGLVVGWMWIIEELVKAATLDGAACEPDEAAAVATRKAAAVAESAR